MELAKNLTKLFNEGPPNLDDIFKKWFNNKQGPGVASTQSPPKLIFTVFGSLLLIWFLSGFYLVKPAEQATVLMLGKYSHTYGQGIHWSPRIISKVYILDTKKIMTLNHTSEMLTADENIVDVSISVWYRISDPKKFLFSVASPILSIQEASASALRQVIGGTSLDQILTTGRDKVMEDTKAQLIKTMAPYNTGLEITEVNLLPAKPPEQVTAAFDDAIKAREDEQRFINQARAYAEKVEPIARGAATRKEQQAQADAERSVLKAKADIAPYNALVKAYKLQPELTKYRLYYSMLGDVLKKTNKIIADDPSALKLLLAGQVKDIRMAAASELSHEPVATKVPELPRRLDYSINSTRETGYE